MQPPHQVVLGGALGVQPQVPDGDGAALACESRRAPAPQPRGAFQIRAAGDGLAVDTALPGLHAEFGGSRDEGRHSVVPETLPRLGGVFGEQLLHGPVGAPDVEDADQSGQAGALGRGGRRLGALLAARRGRAEGHHLRHGPELRVGAAGLGPAHGRQPQVAHLSVGGGVHAAPEGVLVLPGATGVGSVRAGSAPRPWLLHRLGLRQPGLDGGCLFAGTGGHVALQGVGGPGQVGGVNRAAPSPEGTAGAPEFLAYPLHRPSLVFQQVEGGEQRAECELLAGWPPERHGRVGDEQRPHRGASVGGTGRVVGPGHPGARPDQPVVAGDTGWVLHGDPRDRRYGQEGAQSNGSPRTSGRH